MVGDGVLIIVGLGCIAVSLMGLLVITGGHRGRHPVCSTCGDRVPPGGDLCPVCRTIAWRRDRT